MNKNQLGSISSSDLIDAKLEEHQLCGSKHCPGCGHKFEGKPDWLGLPAGVKFDPTDQELVEHLEAKVEEGTDMQSHPLIDEFIPTIEGEDGICYTHPEKLPGVTRDGLSKHFFHRPSKAYTTGTRKRRKIQTECDLQAASGGETRWHKTGKTRPVMVNGKQKGCKKILVLYTNFGKNRKPEKTNWVMHQYHLGQHEEEKEGELVVSKIFYQTQPRQCNVVWSDRINVNNEGINVMEPNYTSGRRSLDSTTGGAAAGSCSSKEAMIFNSVSHGDDDQYPATVLSSYSTAIDMQQHQQQPLESDHQYFTYNIAPFRKSFDEIVGIGEASTARQATCEGRERPQQMSREGPHHRRRITTAAAFHTSRSSPSPDPLHHSSNIILDEDSFQIPRAVLQSNSFQTQQQHHHKMGGRSTSGLEELIMGCTSVTDHTKDESSITNPQETEWLKYSTFWSDPDNHDPHR